MITCKLCLEEKGEESFNTAAKKKNGKNSYCKTCQALKNKLWMSENSSRRSEYSKKHREKSKDHRAHSKKLWDKANFSHRQDYRKLNKHRYAAHAMKRYVTVKLSQPSWLTDTQLKGIESFYWLARDLKAVSGESYHVDHIVPLQGQNFCGLHVPWNLQILPADVNIRKSNRLERRGETLG